MGDEFEALAALLACAMPAEDIRDWNQPGIPQREVELEHYDLATAILDALNRRGQRASESEEAQ